MPGCTSPISPSSSARGTSAATESTTSTSMAPERTSVSADFQRLLAGVGLRDQEVVDLDPELARIDRVERVLGVDEGADAALLLGFRHGVQASVVLPERFRPVNLDHPPARQPADAERDVEAERARWDGLDIHRLVVLAEPHDRALAEIALDLGERGIEGLRLVHGGTFDETQRSSSLLGHRSHSL